jgi:hypothetical protein
MAGLLVAFISVEKIRFLVETLYPKINRLIGSHATQILLGILVLCMGIGAHWFKRMNQLWYGMVEIMFGAFSGFCIAYTMYPSTAHLTQWSSLVGCAYVIARGFNNVSDAGKTRANAA